MQFTGLHRLLGIGPGPLTDAMIDDAVAQKVAKTDDLDWKSELPAVMRCLRPHRSDSAPVAIWPMPQTAG